MSKFEELLRASLGGANAQTDAVEADLNNEVHDAAGAIERLTDGQMTLTLSKKLEGLPDVVYGLMIGPRSSPRQEVLGLRISPTGYPILAASHSSFLLDAARRSDWRSIPDREHLTALFAELAVDPGSPLVVSVAYFLRERKTATEKREPIHEGKPATG